MTSDNDLRQIRFWAKPEKEARAICRWLADNCKNITHTTYGGQEMIFMYKENKK